MSNSVSRREALMSLFSVPSAIASLSVQKRTPASSKVGKPKFWFGDVIRYSWFNVEEGKTHWETGNVMGVVWHPDEEQWLYIINWTDSTCDRTSFNYPSFDECLTDGSKFELVKS